MSAKKVSLIQKLMVFMLVGIFSVCLLTAPASAADITGNSGEDRVYSDLSRSNPYFNYIKYLSQRGIVAGFPDGSFRPEESVSRAEAAVMLAKAMELEAGPAGETSFHDVGKNHWAAAYIESCAKAGYMKGYPDGSFHPDEILSRSRGGVGQSGTRGARGAHPRRSLECAIDYEHQAKAHPMKVGEESRSGTNRLDRPAGISPRHQFRSNNSSRTSVTLS